MSDIDDLLDELLQAATNLSGSGKYDGPASVGVYNSPRQPFWHAQVFWQNRESEMETAGTPADAVAQLAARLQSLAPR
jgi:hypothetical protein